MEGCKRNLGAITRRLSTETSTCVRVFRTGISADAEPDPTMRLEMCMVTESGLTDYYCLTEEGARKWSIYKVANRD